MRSRYKVVLSGRNLYREIDLSPDAEKLTAGSFPDVDVRLRREMFFGLIQLEFAAKDGGWSVTCSDNLYFNTGDVRKLLNIPLGHGTECSVCYQDSDNEAFFLRCFIDFDYEMKDYGRKIDIAGVESLRIGGSSDADICITDEYLGQDTVLLRRQDRRLWLIDQGCRYGVQVNGTRISGRREIRDRDFFSLGSYSFYYRKDALYTSEKQSVRVKRLHEEWEEQRDTVFSYPAFHRNTRMRYEIPEESVEIRQPPAKPNLSRRSIVLTLMPVLVMLAMTIVLRGVLGGGGTFVIYSAVSMGTGALVSLLTYLQDKKNFQEETEKRESSYLCYIEEKEKEIRERQYEELRIRRRIYESPENSLQEAFRFGRRLFERTREDADYLQVFLGTGRIEASEKVTFTKQDFVDTEDSISMLPEQLAGKYRWLDDAPVVSDFLGSGGVGIVGRRNDLRQMLKNITLDLAIRHFYGELRFVYIFALEDAGKFSWLRWLRNVENDSLDTRNIVCDEESRNVILENIYMELSDRESVLSRDRQHVFEEEYIVFVTDSSLIRSHPAAKYISDAGKYGFTFVFLEEHEENLPQGCAEIIRLGEQQSGRLLKTRNGEVFSDFTYSVFSDRMAEKAALKLGAVYVDEISLENQLTKNITLFELLGIFSAEDLDLAQRWKNSQVYRTLAAPVGVRAGDEVVQLNISDRGGGHGPHGLVAGTTGSGKSEFLQTYILSMATLFHPYDVSFVLIDFKGGGMANQFAGLPHLAGTITNIDGREIDRFLLSVKAELIRRQEIFSGAGVNHIDDYIRLFQSGKAERPVPHLIIIADEFAELKTEYPDFMKELISAARIGRTLGVHLILATQKPTGVVDPQIWSNSRFRVCLKVQTKEDSNEVLKSPLAAEITEPGRAYFQVGNNEIFDMIQSAYSGADVPSGDDIKDKIFSVYERNLWGKKKLIYTNKKIAGNTESVSQLKAVVDHIGRYCSISGIRSLPGICLPPLKTVIGTEELSYDADPESNVITIPVGMFDDPRRQRQGNVLLEPSRENVYIVGSAQSGKTVLLQTVFYGIIRKYSPRQVNVYIVDCGSMVLKIFENSAHVGGVVLPNEEEKCRNLFKLLSARVAERKQKLSERGIGTFASYLSAGGEDMPLIIVMIDNMAAFKEYFPAQADQLNVLTREAQSVGISFIVTAAASNAMNYRVQANFARKLALNSNDTAEYSALLGHCRQTPRGNPGSGLLLIDRQILEWQAAIFSGEETEAGRSRNFREFIGMVNAGCDTCAEEIPMVPDRLVLDDEMAKSPEKFREPGMIPLGMEYETVSFSCMDIGRTGSLAILGDAEISVRLTKTILRILASNIIFHDVEAIVIDDRRKSLESVNRYGFVKNYTSDPGEALEFLSEFYDELRERKNAEHPEELSAMMLVLNQPELFRKICADKNAAGELSAALKQAGGARAFILLPQMENAAVGFNASEVLKTLKEMRQGVLCAPVTENRFYEISGRVRADSDFDRTMAYRFEGGRYTRIKLFETEGE